MIIWPLNIPCQIAKTTAQLPRMDLTIKWTYNRARLTILSFNNFLKYLLNCLNVSLYILKILKWSETRTWSVLYIYLKNRKTLLKLKKKELSIRWIFTLQPLFSMTLYKRVTSNRLPFKWFLNCNTRLFKQNTKTFETQLFTFKNHPFGTPQKFC